MHVSKSVSESGAVNDVVLAEQLVGGAGAPAASPVEPLGHEEAPERVEVPGSVHLHREDGADGAVVRQPGLAAAVAGLPQPRAAPQDAVAPRRRAPLVAPVALAGGGAAVVGVGVGVVLVGRGEGDGALAPALERAAAAHQLGAQLVVLQQRLPVLPLHQQPRLGLRQGDPVVEVPEQDHSAAQQKNPEPRHQIDRLSIGQSQSLWLCLIIGSSSLGLFDFDYVHMHPV